MGPKLDNKSQTLREFEVAHLGHCEDANDVGSNVVQSEVLWIGNLPAEISVHGLRTLLENHLAVDDIPCEIIMKNSSFGKRLPYAFARFRSVADAARVKTFTHDTELADTGKRLIIHYQCQHPSTVGESVLWVGSIPKRRNHDDLVELFSPYGINAVSPIRLSSKGRFAFVNFAKESDAKRCAAELSARKAWGACSLEIRLQKPRSRHSGDDNNNSSNDNNGNGNNKNLDISNQNQYNQYGNNGMNQVHMNHHGMRLPQQQQQHHQQQQHLPFHHHQQQRTSSFHQQYPQQQQQHQHQPQHRHHHGSNSNNYRSMYSAVSPIAPSLSMNDGFSANQRVNDYHNKHAADLANSGTIEFSSGREGWSVLHHMHLRCTMSQMISISSSIFGKLQQLPDLNDGFTRLQAIVRDVPIELMILRKRLDQDSYVMKIISKSDLVSLSLIEPLMVLHQQMLRYEYLFPKSSTPLPLLNGLGIVDEILDMCISQTHSRIDVQKVEKAASILSQAVDFPLPTLGILSSFRSLYGLFYLVFLASGVSISLVCKLQLVKVLSQCSTMDAGVLVKVLRDVLSIPGSFQELDSKEHSLLRSVDHFIDSENDNNPQFVTYLRNARQYLLNIISIVRQTNRGSASSQDNLTQFSDLNQMFTQLQQQKEKSQDQYGYQYGYQSNTLLSSSSNSTSTSPFNGRMMPQSHMPSSAIDSQTAALISELTQFAQNSSSVSGSSSVASTTTSVGKPQMDQMSTVSSSTVGSSSANAGTTTTNPITSSATASQLEQLLSSFKTNKAQQQQQPHGGRNNMNMNVMSNMTNSGARIQVPPPREFDFSETRTSTTSPMSLSPYGTSTAGTGRDWGSVEPSSLYSSTSSLSVEPLTANMANVQLHHQHQQQQQHYQQRNMPSGMATPNNSIYSSANSFGSIPGAFNSFVPTANVMPLGGRNFSNAAIHSSMSGVGLTVRGQQQQSMLEEFSKKSPSRPLRPNGSVFRPTAGTSSSASSIADDSKLNNRDSSSINMSPSRVSGTSENKAVSPISKARVDSRLVWSMDDLRVL
eukprot:TRINITY_DN685_c6_g1_i1.p1 TRINITY_DN685_c6_g1~~TRINITY_DN685_c6_g1_i1.p1  ORF type:complete len:1044 (+),score=362.05 TRINITY_DN685_c6_g1_i1:116-3247(+)